MNNHDAIDTLNLQYRRFSDLMRLIDSGIWWQGDERSRIDVDKVLAQSAIIESALDKLNKLVKKIAA